MMPAAVFVVPGCLETRTGGYIYTRRIVDGLRSRGWRVDVAEIDGSFPVPAPPALDVAARAFAEIADGAIVVVDSLALGAMPDLIAREAARLRIVALMHLPLAADPALGPEAARRVEEGERRALACAARVIVTGKAARPMLDRYGIQPHRIAVVEPGTDRAPLAHGSDGTIVRLLCAATVNAGKGHDVLLEALAGVRGARWHLSCAGSLTRDPATAARIRAMVTSLGLSDRVSLRGDLDAPALAAAYDSADVFVLASRQETYGMAVAEALAHGLPVVGTRTGAIAGLVGDEAGIVVPPCDTAALGEALSRVIGDSSLRAHLAAGARRVRERLRTWEEASAHMAEALAIDG